MPQPGWYGPALNDIAANDGGSHLGPVTVGVIHTTESAVGKYRKGSSTNYGNFGHANFPHFTVDEQGGQFRVWQHISLGRAGRALKNRSGGVQTNREGCIQIEVVGSATKPFTSRPVIVEGLKALMRWIEENTDIPRATQVEWTRYPESYGVRAKQRLSPARWVQYRGWLGHQHVPENDHGDPGRLDIDLLLGDQEPVGPPAPLVYGEIGVRWVDLGGERGFGKPLIAETPTPDGRGRYNHFENGRSIYWTPTTGAHPVVGNIRVAWERLGWETGVLGYPVEGEGPVTVENFVEQRFEHGTLSCNLSNGEVYVDGRVL